MDLHELTAGASKVSIGISVPLFMSNSQTTRSIRALISTTVHAKVAKRGRVFLHKASTRIAEPFKLIAIGKVSRQQRAGAGFQSRMD
jgi:hypothetical protein